VRTYAECIPCFLRQALEAARMASPDEAVHERVVREVARAAGSMEMRSTPPEMAQVIHRAVREASGVTDPYRELKSRSNRAALSVYPRLARDVAAAGDPFEAALRFAIVGNIIDCGTGNHIPPEALDREIEAAWRPKLDTGRVGALRSKLEEAGRVLYLGDNAGEIVFDRLLLEQIDPSRVTFVVRGAPVLNDATIEDAAAAGLTEMIEVIANGSDAPGTILSDCSAAFVKRFRDADLVIAKGQGNFESLEREPGRVFFVLQAKCPVIARDLGCEVGDFIVTD